MPDPDYCPGHNGHYVYVDTANGPRRLVKCSECEAIWSEVPYKVGPGAIPFHEKNAGESP